MYTLTAQDHTPVQARACSQPDEDHDVLSFATDVPNAGSDGCDVALLSAKQESFVAYAMIWTVPVPHCKADKLTKKSVKRRRLSACGAKTTCREIQEDSCEIACASCFGTLGLASASILIG